MAPTDRAVVVGIDRYPFLDPADPNDPGKLKGPQNDAREFARWLVDAGGGDVPDTRVTTILSSDFPNDAHRPSTDDIDQAFSAIIREASERPDRKGGRRLYLFFAGHGFSNPADLEDTALLMANAARGMTGFHIPGRAYANWFRTAALFDEIVLLMDCCRELRQSAPQRVVPFEPRPSPPPSRIFIGYATDLSMAARERPSPEHAHEVRGRFSEAVVAGLRRAVDDQGRVTAHSLKKFVLNQMQAEANSTGERQEPKIEDLDDIVFKEGLGLPYELDVTFPVGHAPTLLSGGDLTTILEPSATTDTSRRWRLRPALYLLRSATKQEVVPLLGTGGSVHVAL